MIRTEEEYQEALARVQDEEQAVAKERERLIAQGISPEHADIAMEPYVAFRMQFLDEIEEYLPVLLQKRKLWHYIAATFVVGLVVGYSPTISPLAKN